MQQDLPTIGGVAREMLESFTRRTRSDGSSAWSFRDDIEWQHRILSRALKCSELPECCSEAVFYVLMEIYVAENVEQAEDFLSDITPYQSLDKLTSWLNADPANLDYVTQVLQEKAINDGKMLLAQANLLFLKNIGTRVITAIEDYISTSTLVSPSLN